LIYTNLIYFLIVILVLSTNSIPERPQLPFFTALGIFIIKTIIYQGLLKRIFSSRLLSGAAYSNAERRASILAIVFFSIDIYLLDFQYYCGLLPLARTMPSIIDLGGLLLFMAYLIMMWAAAAAPYNRLFGQGHSTRNFIRTNVESNLPIILPWLILSLLADFLRQAPIPLLKTVLNSSWGEPVISLLFFICLALTFPALIVRVWRCTSMPDGPERRRLESFCRKYKVGYSDIMIWPMFEGQALTAGVMGLIPGCRYLLITPALLQALTPEEIEAVMAHELGHVKLRHLQIYILLFLGFGLLTQLSTYPILYILANSSLFYKMVHLVNKQPSHALATAQTGAMFILMIVYFRYILGFFMRNFERQADAFALKAMGSAEPLVRVFDKIAWLSGTSHDQPSWHHFSISQRIDFLQRCEADAKHLHNHNRKIYGSLAAYLLILVLSALTLWQMPDNLMAGAPQEKYAQAVIQQKMADDPQNFVWPQLLGDLNYSRSHYQDAIAAYEKSLLLNPDNAEVLNNLAWLLLTTDIHSIHNRTAALRLAKRAVIQLPAPHILDTLALAYFANGHNKQAIQVEERAFALDPANRAYYINQLKKFARQLKKTSESLHQ